MNRGKIEGTLATPVCAAMAAEVERVAGDPGFAVSARLKKLLRFLVAEVMAGRGAGLRGDFIARRVFERGERFDPSVDNIVRVEMSKLRRALNRWYATAGGSERIEIPPGTYVPRLSARAEAPESGPRSSRTSLVSGGPVIVVRPFASSADDGAPAALARHLPERLAVLLSRVPFLVVHQDAAGVAEGAYSLEGSVRGVARSVRATLTLRGPEGQVVWGDTRAGVADESGGGAFEEELLALVFMQLFSLECGVLHWNEANWARRTERPVQTGYDAILRFIPWFWTFSRVDTATARAAAETVLENEPDAVTVLHLLATLHVLSTWTRHADPRAQALATELAQRALTAHPAVSAPHIALSLVHLNAGDGARMREAAERAAATGTGTSGAAFVLAVAGDWARGTAMLRRPLDLGISVPGWVHHPLFLDAYRRGDYAAALAEACLIAMPEIAWDPLDRAAALGKLGRVDEARAAVVQLLDIVPAFRADPRAHLARITPDSALADALLEGLKMAGLERFSLQEIARS